METTAADPIPEKVKATAEEMPSAEVMGADALAWLLPAYADWVKAGRPER